MARQKHTEQGGRLLNSFQDYRPKDYGKPEYEITNSIDDLQALVRLGIQTLKKGRAKYENNDEGLELLKKGIVDYFRYIHDTNEGLEEQKIYPDIEGLAMFLRIDRTTLFGYERRGDEWRETIATAKTAITAVKKQLSSTYKIPPVLAIFDLANNSGYRNVAEFKLQQETPPDTISAPRIDTREISGLLESPDIPQ